MTESEQYAVSMSEAELTGWLEFAALTDDECADRLIEDRRSAYRHDFWQELEAMDE